MDLKTAKKCLLNKNAEISLRMDAAFTLKNIATEEAISALSEGLNSDSILLTHEIAYVLGQMQNPFAVPILTQILCDCTIDPITRHEAGEGLAAIGDQSAKNVLSDFINDEDINVAQTCLLGLSTLKFKKNLFSQGKEWPKSSKFDSMDPAPPNGCGDLEKLENDLLDENASLFERYSAMFQLREIGSDEAVLKLCRGFESEGSLFCHEIAYVLGQLRSTLALDSLESVLRDKNRHLMVRHEAAEAIGSISGEKAESILKEFSKDTDRIVRESCEVALKLNNFWTENTLKS